MRSPALCALLLLLTAALAFPAEGGSVFRLAFDSATSAQVSDIFPNVGQQGHTLSIYLSDESFSDHYGFEVWLEASYNRDGSTWFPISPIASVAKGGQSANSVTIYANGNYPFVRANLGSVTSASVTAAYFGSPSPVPNAITTRYHYFPIGRAPGASTAADVILLAPNKHTVSVVATGTPATCSIQLEGSLDGLHFVDLSGPQTCTAPISMFHVVDRPVSWVRVNLTALTGGISPMVQASYLGER